MGVRNDMFKLRKDESPGPGHYKAEVVDLKRNSQSYKWGRDSRFDSTGKSRKDNPGPGMYSTQRGFGGPLYGFGTSTRPGNISNSGASAKDNFPGPGSYNRDREFINKKSYDATS